MEAKRQAALARAVERMEAGKVRRAPRPAIGDRIADKVLQSMAPREWYGMGDMARMIGADRKARSKVHQVLRLRKWIERAPNPEWSATFTWNDREQPKWLWRLTEAGIVERDRIGAVVSGRLDGFEKP